MPAVSEQRPPGALAPGCSGRLTLAPPCVPAASPDQACRRRACRSHAHPRHRSLSPPACAGDPSRYISHLPVHQDGSCNGLQHYAALGRDLSGGFAVNLTPSDKPQAGPGREWRMAAAASWDDASRSQASCRSPLSPSSPLPRLRPPPAGRLHSDQPAGQEEGGCGCGCRGARGGGAGALHAGCVGGQWTSGTLRVCMPYQLAAIARHSKPCASCLLPLTCSGPQAGQADGDDKRVRSHLCGRARAGAPPPARAAWLTLAGSP